MRSNMRGYIALSAALTATSTMATSAFAYDETGSTANANSAPIYRAVADRIASVKNIPYPGTMKLEIDATDVDQSIFKVKQTIPVAKSGRITLLYPEWLPGNHAPRGEIEKLAGLKIMAGAMELPWTRDSGNVYAFHVNVPTGTKNITAEFQFLSATAGNQGRVVMASNMLNLRWHAMSLYPAGYYARQIPVQATVKYPAGWRAATALRGTVKAGNVVAYEQTDYDTLVDSPVFAGRNFAQHQLSDKVRLNIVSDEPEQLVSTDEQIEHHRKLVREAVNLFGGEQYDRYDFLLALTNEMGGIGLEHHRSSENGVGPEYFTEWKNGPGRRNLLPHELVHSWNGKYRRPDGMWTPDFRTPMHDNLLWVYEGQTQFWGYVLGARSGLFSKQDTLDAIASIAAGLDTRVGREWRALEDTTHDPIISARKPKGWSSWQRSEDYYNEGMLIWLEVDGILRRETKGRKSLDNFAKLFFAGRDGDYGVVPYNFDTVVATLNKVHPYGWKNLLRKRLTEKAKEAPKDGLRLGGYRLTYGSKQSAFAKAREARSKSTNLAYSIGLYLSRDGKINGLVWDGPAFKAGLRRGTKILAVNDRAYSKSVMIKAIIDNAGKKEPIRLLTKNNDKYRTFSVDYSGGLRYPRLEKLSNNKNGNSGGIDMLLKAQTK